MTQDERWLANCEKTARFVETNRRKPSRYFPEERNLRSWWKNTKKRMNAGELRPEKWKTLKKLQELMEQYRRKNQYE